MSGFYGSICLERRQQFVVHGAFNR